MNYLTLLTLFPKKINVTFVDATSNQILSKRKMLKDELPEVFDKPTVLTLDGEPWQVITANPVSGDDFHYSKKLTLTIQRKTDFDTSNQRSLVPTHADTLPVIIPGIYSETIHINQWMQLQFLPIDLMPVIETDLGEITKILETGNNLVGYPSPYTRSNIPLQAIHIPMNEFCDLISVSARGTLGVESQGVIHASFLTHSHSHVYYGIVENDIITSLCLREFEYVDDEFSLLTEKFQIALVDWCNGTVVGG
ncbi:hypothetical protein [Chitinophaga pinensis]|uniref:Uncharacterized protein n=1 Tax=Chitinophaga pinensis (strain ATCC 43595 / DSM 2588 / LMG 13176 / NBRC 15968 / NCIMB 11800 / UQM 2034) TaxID=485918 RepID=A0A979G0F8_CHIPD|nr:hypothetical protein [Chitinophaga pinensis]ACU58482.1 hypothetical protein Cpin_0984 [Chitinophaga pinensis DSM 2588]